MVLSESKSHQKIGEWVRHPRIQYDAAGNLINDGTHNYSYDAENRISKVDTSTATYAYDAEGRRSQRIVNGVSTVYLHDLSGNVIGELDGGCGATCWARGLVYFNNQLLAKYESSTTSFVSQDHLDSTRLTTNLSGGVNDSMDYLPFGEQIAGGSGTTHKFTGKERDVESGLDNFGARYDSSQLGRFMTPDWSAKPQGVPYAVLDDPQSLNLYAYVRNNPLNRTDPSGHCTVDGEKHGVWWCVAHAIGATETRKEYNNRIDTERQWLVKNARNPDGTALSSSQRSALGGASSGQVDSLYQGYARTIALNSIFGFNMSDEATSPDPKDWGRDASGALVPLIRLHGEGMIGSSARYDFWNGKTTEEIIESLKEGSEWGALKVRPNGLVLDGNTRIKILEERGIDVNLLERVIIEPKP